MAKTCHIDHAKGDLPTELRKLPESQAGSLRHKCAGCAYVLGLKHGLEIAGDRRKTKQIARAMETVEHVH